MRTTVAICTLNRAESLRRTLSSLASMQVSADLDWEVVVVDNGSIDRTPDVVNSFVNRLPVRCVLEPRRGLSHARNRAIDTATGKYMAWTDDDVVVNSGWLMAYVSAFQQWPAAAVFGGPIVPRLEPPIPNWLLETGGLLGRVFAERDYGDKALPLFNGRSLFVPYGPNFAVRIVEQRKFRYNIDLGLAPRQRRRGEETDVIRRIMDSGASGYWVPDARVEHCIRSDMQTISYISGVISTQEEAFLALGGHKPVKSRLFGAPRWLWRQLIEGWVCFQFHRVISPAAVWVKHLEDYSSTLGAIRYWRSEKG